MPEVSPRPSWLVWTVVACAVVLFSTLGWLLSVELRLDHTGTVTWDVQGGVSCDNYIGEG